ncbi:caspase family protein [Mesorhizobium sp. ZC-5]|uniref:caspase family protein n=1 Tax=Mesorhizobium sp. ZC-5 TaxID=2986066 RepID=UPI0021E8301B|nr:caspase domain-containing protein [Mesorhizobium sp. ZC-5]MCV3241343.1 caspase domain-containing protein [Mesorhizobium sp. ZC-5]
MARRRSLARNLGLALVALLLTLGTASADRRVALVLGNSQYQHAPALINPVRDAKAISTRLEQLGFEVISGFDLTKLRTQETIAQFARQVRGADVALLFYAGHGLQVSGANYLLPVDAALEDETSLDFEAVQIDFILRQMSRETSVRLIFLDACRDNPLAEVLAKAGGNAKAGSGLAEIQIENGGSGTLVAFATSPNQVAYDGAGEHSPFSAALLAHIGEPNISITEAMNRVTGDVFKATSGKQRPWLNVSLTTEVVLHKIDLNAPLIVGEAAPHPGQPGSEVRNATGVTDPSGSEENAQIALNLLRQQIPKLESDRPVLFDLPIDFGDPAIDGKSIAQLIQGKPRFSPVEGLEKQAWDQHCSACHQWTKERLCEQAGTYDRIDVSVLRLQHPLGTRFKVALANWAKNGCK